MREIARSPFADALLEEVLITAEVETRRKLGDERRLQVIGAVSADVTGAAPAGRDERVAALIVGQVLRLGLYLCGDSCGAPRPIAVGSRIPSRITVEQRLFGFVATRQTKATFCGDATCAIEIGILITLELMRGDSVTSILHGSRHWHDPRPR